MVRLVVVALAFAALAVGCDVQVKERFRTESTVPSDTTLVDDEADAEDGTAITSTTLVSSLRGVPIPSEALVDVDEKVSVLGRQVDVVATLDWTQTWSEDLFELEFGAVVRLDLTLLRVNELERLGILAEGDAPDPSTRWYSVVGTVRHDVTDAMCTPGDQVEQCEIVFVTDGALTGLASRRDDVLTVALEWQTLGRNDTDAVPAVGIQYRDRRGANQAEERSVLAASLRRARFVGSPGTSVAVGRDNGRVVRTRDGSGVFEVRDVN